jgi:hypothetical protein
MFRLNIDLRDENTFGSSCMVDDNELYSAALGKWGAIELKGMPFYARIEFEQDEHSELVKQIKKKNHVAAYKEGIRLMMKWLCVDEKRMIAVLHNAFEAGVYSGTESKTKELRKALGLND